jgi:hypothetical protein
MLGKPWDGMDQVGDRSSRRKICGGKRTGAGVAYGDG